MSVIEHAKGQAKEMLLTVIIPTLCYEETVSFYRDVLGLSVRGGKHGVRLVTDVGYLGVIIKRVDPDSEFAPSGHGIYFSLIVSDVEQIEKRLLATQARILERYSGGHVVLALDPNGNLVELIGLRPSEDKPVPLVHMKMKMLISLVSQMCFMMTEFINNPGIGGMGGDLVEQLCSTHTKLEEIRDRARQQLGIEPDSEEHLEEVDYQKLRVELVALDRELYSLAETIEQVAVTSRTGEMGKKVENFKELLDNLSMLPD